MNNVIATLVAVVVTLLLIVVAVVIGQQLFTAGNAQKAVSEVQALNHAAHSLLVGQNNWGSQDLTGALASSGLAPAEMISGSALYDPWGGAVNVYAVQAGNCWNAAVHAGQCIEVDFANVPNSDCAQMVASVPIGCGQREIDVNASNFSCGAGQTPAWAASVCTGNSNTVDVQYGQN